jgi:uncharacterized protein
VSLNIAMVDHGIEVNGVLEGTFVRQCVRCLKEYDDAAELPFRATYEHTLPLKRGSARPAAKGLKATESFQTVQDPDPPEEPYHCHGDRLEFAEMLREQIILAAPIQPLCDEGCRGLCPVCGQDLNERTCGCSQGPMANPFRILRELQKRLNEGG